MSGSPITQVDRERLAEEHHRLRHDRGLVDWRGAGVFDVSGPGAVDFLDAVCTRSVAFLVEERTLPALALDEEGGVVAVLDVFCRGDRYTVLVWPEQREAAWAHLAAQAAGRPGIVLTDRSAEQDVVAVEGPLAARSVDAFVDGGVEQIPYKGFTVAEWQECELVIARIGVTAEFGYTLMAPASLGGELRHRLVELGALPCGRDSVDVCRMESRFVSLEADRPDPRALPFEMGLQWMIDPTHDFAGKQALLERWPSPQARLPVCFTAPAGARLGPHDVVAAGDVAVGSVTNALWSPGLHCIAGVAHLDADVAAAGLAFEVRTGPDRVPITTCSGPFVVPTSVAAGRG